MTERETKRNSERRAKGHRPLRGRPHSAEEEDQPEPSWPGERSRLCRNHCLLYQLIAVTSG
jgi:hypothetical protein